MTTEIDLLPQGKRVPLTNEIARALYPISANHLAETCEELGLEPGTREEAFSNKEKYVTRRCQKLNDLELLQFARLVQNSYPRFGLLEFLRNLDDGNQLPISDLTRRTILKELDNIPLFGEQDATVELKKLFPDYQMTTWPDFLDSSESRIKSNSQMLEDAGARTCSKTLFFLLLEQIVSPNSRVAQDQEQTVAQLNRLLCQDGYRLQPSGHISGHPSYTVSQAAGGVSGSPKNLIFASIGPKPEIVLNDAINNDIQIIKNAESCLIYDRPIGPKGLTKGDLISWWMDREGSPNEKEGRRSLVDRLRKSLPSNSPGQQMVFTTYYKAFADIGEALPALIPEVYLHYDPYSLKQLKGDKRLFRQRMDFLILFSSSARIVVEIDGIQHIAESDGRASMKKYSEMMSADRNLLLAGYEVYHFGTGELAEAGAELRIKRFFELLLKKHMH